MKKKKIFTISDHPLAPSGVGTQTKYFIEALLKTGRYEVFSFGGAIKHEKYNPMRTPEWKDDWTILPVDGYGNQDLVRSAIRYEKPDILWFMTDPRFWSWLWQMDNEIRPLCPMVYYHVWDNYPYPTFNKKWYASNDVVCTISKVTDDIIANVVPETERHYIPHAVDADIFKKMPALDVMNSKIQTLGSDSKDKFVFMWNNRNARRKQSGSLIFWFKEFLDRVGHDKACLIMHTDPKDPNGQDLVEILKHLGLSDGQILLSTQKYPPENLSMMYNMADCTINISDAEGFGLATLESLSCKTPIITTMTGGLQDQVTNGEEWFGIGLEPCSRAIIGSQEIPWIYEDRLCGDDVVEAMVKIYNMSKEEREYMGERGYQHVLKNYNFEKTQDLWVEVIDGICEKHGSWENRKNYQGWNLTEIK
jgi:glycosyltransferase involved in cell wall biosynthesis